MKTVAKIMGVLFGVVGIWLLLDLYVYYKAFLRECTSYLGGIELLFPAIMDRAVDECNYQLLQSDGIGWLVFLLAFALLSCYAGYALLFKGDSKAS